MAKKHIGLRGDPDLVAKRFRLRISYAWLGSGRKGGIHVLSVYLWTAEGTSQRNKDLLGEVERITKTLRGPWVVGGDFNLDPEEVKSWATSNGANVYCPDYSTCNQRCLDYFIAHRSIAESIAGCQLISYLGGQPHFGVRLLIDSRANDGRIWAIKKPKQFPSKLPAGCKLYHTDYNLAAGLSGDPSKPDNPQAVSEALRQWYDYAENELIDIMGLEEEEAVAYRRRSDGMVPA